MYSLPVCAGSRLFYWPDRDLYLAYGQVGNKGVGFYPADERGNVERGADRVEEARLVPLYTPAEPPTKEGEKLLVLYLPGQMNIRLCQSSESAPAAGH